jgi:hypothetical protein
MPTPCAQRPSIHKEQFFRLPSSDSTAAADAVLGEIRLRALCDSPARFNLDCARITEISPRLLAEIAALRDELNDEGSDIVLVNCGDSLRRQLTLAKCAPQLGEPSVRHEAQPLRGPHAAFLRSFRSA